MGTTAQKLTYLNETKSQLKDMINYGLDSENKITNETTFREYVNSTFEAFIESLRNPDTLFNNLPKVTEEGASVTLNSTANAPMRITLNANELEQESTTGKNLLPNTVGAGRENHGITFTLNSDGTYTLNGTQDNVGSSASYIIQNGSLVLSAGTYYTILTGNNLIEIVAYDGTNYKTIASNSVSSFTLSEETTFINIYVQVNRSSSLTLNNFKVYPMISTTSVTTDTYEPYTNGASPNPDYPQNIHSISGDNSVVVEGKNLLNPDYMETTTNNVYFYRNIGVLLKANTTYTLSYKGSNPLLGLYFKKYGTNTNLATAYTKYFLSYTPTEDTKVWFDLYSTDIDTAISNFQLEVGSTATTYEPYEEQTLPLNLPVKNLFDKTMTTTPGYISDAGVIGGSAGTYHTSDFIPIIPNTSYVYSGATNIGGVPSRCYYDINKNFISGIQHNSQNPFVDTSPSNAYYMRESIDIVNINNLQIEKGSKANSYTPYGTTPIEYCKIGNYADEFILTSGKNLLNLGQKEASYQGAIIYMDTNTITFTGAEDGTSAFSFTGNQQEVSIPQNTELTYSVNYKSGKVWSSGTFVIRLRLYYEDNTTENITGLSQVTTSNYTTQKSITFIAQKNITKIEFYGNTYAISGLNSPISFNLQLEKGSTATPYEPYGSNEWYLKKHIGKVVLDENRDWYSGDNRYSLKYFYTNKFTLDKINGGSVFSDNFTQVPTLWNFQTYTPCIITEDNNKIIGIMLGDNTIQNANAFKTWLSTHNTILYYPLATPTYTQITGTLETQLENIYKNALSYDNQTNISQTNNDLPFIINASAIKKYE